MITEGKNKWKEMIEAQKQSDLTIKQFCDMKKQIARLSLIVTFKFNMNVLDHSLFIFTSASCNRIKMLYYEANGFWLFTRRLEKGKFKFEKHEETGVLVITP